VFVKISRHRIHRTEGAALIRRCHMWAVHRRDEKRTDMMSFQTRCLLTAALAVFLACHAYAAVILMRGEGSTLSQVQSGD
jgi:hypothetical protein